jgi:hypothetical protein
MHEPPVLILGVPRSGSTWVERVLSAAGGVRVAHEPDNETEMPWPLIAKARLGRFPLLHRGDSAPAYEALWCEALSGGAYPRRVERARRLQQRWLSYEAAEAACDPRRRPPPAARALALMARPASTRQPRLRALAKSVHAALCADWLAERFQPAILVVRRDPVEVVASWWSMGARPDRHSERLEYAGRPERLLSPAAMRHLSAGYGPPPATQGGALIWLAGALMAELAGFGARSPDVTVLDFDAACADPLCVLSAVAQSLGLQWGAESEATLRAIDRPGEGWDVARETARVPGAWRRRLEAAEVAEIEKGLSRFGLGGERLAWSYDAEVVSRTRRAAPSAQEPA